MLEKSDVNMVERSQKSDLVAKSASLFVTITNLHSYDIVFII